MYVVARHQTTDLPRRIEPGRRAAADAALTFREYARQLSPAARLIDESRLATWGRFLGLAHLAGRPRLQLQGFHQLMKITRTFT